MYDVCIIGSGIVGACIARELSKYKLELCILEKNNDVAMGASSANSGIVHAGFDAKENTLKAKFNVWGNRLIPNWAKELNVNYKNNGSLVVAYSESDLKTILQLQKRGEHNGVKTEILSKDLLMKKEPNISETALGALFASTGGIICPYELTIAATGNAMDNGAELKRNFRVDKIIDKGDFLEIYSEKNMVEAKYIINCAGIYSDSIAHMAGDDSFHVYARKGEYMLLDKNSGNLVTSTVFSCPDEKGKGVLVSQTVDGNLILGPTSNENNDKEDNTTSNDGLNEIRTKTRLMCKNIPYNDVITSFCGIRAYCDRHDFIVEESKVQNKMFLVAGIESPGLTSAPAIAEYVSEFVANKLKLEKKKDFNPIRKSTHEFGRMSQEEKNKVIRKDKNYGQIICRCEEITLGEILSAIRTNPKAITIDGIKRRTRAGMGRCQGGFCQPAILEILAEESGISPLKVEKGNQGSYILERKTK